MTGLRGKLRRAFGVDGAAAGAEPLPASTTFDLAARLRRQEERRLRRVAAVELPGGAEAENARGRFWLRRLEYRCDDRHGHAPLSPPEGPCWPRLAELARLDALQVAPDQLLFLDTETTGLAGGAGTVVFLCGLGFFDAGRLIVEQAFLRAFAEEPAALLHVAQRLEQHPWLVTFVGKTFDRHRLAARMTVHRVAAPVLADRHLDLYHLARRRWRHELPDVKLRTVEERRLGVVRPDDLPGAQAPRAFLGWLRDRTGPVDRVFEHNRLDVLSLVTLLATLGAP